MMRKIELLLIVLAVLAGNLGAGTKDDNKISQQETENRLKASEELVTAMKIQEGWQQTLNNMIEVQTKQIPGMVELKEVFEEFFSKYMGWESIKEDYIKMYAEEFTAAELKEITAFYKTPVGEKLALKMPVLTKKGAEIGQKKVKDNMLELQIMLSDKMAEIEKTRTGEPNE